MGIPHYFHTVTQAHKGILHFSRPVSCQHLFVDFNGAIHQAVRAYMDAHPGPITNEDDERNLMEEVWKYTQHCHATVTPQHIGLYIDGVAPVAKINQQRKRRYLSVFRHKQLGVKADWDTNAISPGTSFMNRLQAFLRQKIRDDRHGHKYVLSAADEPGEGEHKIFSKLTSIPAEEVVFIHGLDADLIMLSLMSHRKNLYLMREPSPPYTEESTDDGFLYLDIAALREGLLHHLRHVAKWPISTLDPYDEEGKSVIETYVVLCFLLGNDFLPHSVTISLKNNGHERILEAAKSAWELFPGAVSNNTVFMPFIAHVLSILKKHEDQDLWNVNERYMKQGPSPYKDDVENYPMHNKSRLCHDIYALGKPSGWRSMYYKRLFHTQRSDTRLIANACQTYLEGVAWTYRYYKRLPRPSFWYYPYGYAPSVLDLSNHLEGTLHEWDEKQQTWNKETVSWLSPPTQLACILPSESHHLIPAKARSKLDLCSFMYPSEYEIQTYLHRYLWECNPVLPRLDIDWMRKCIEE